MEYQSILIEPVLSEKSKYHARERHTYSRSIPAADKIM
jgi:hypothetical protein